MGSQPGGGLATATAHLPDTLHVLTSISLALCVCDANDAADSVLHPGPQELEMAQCRGKERASPGVGEEGKADWAFSRKRRGIATGVLDLGLLSSWVLAPPNRSPQWEPRALTSKTLSSGLILFLS